jgi:TRAP transporter 4TM/12TM fusion protein
MRELKGKTAIAVASWCVIAALFHIYTAPFLVFEPREQRSLHLLLVVPIAYLLFPAHPRWSPKDRPSILDLVLAGLAIPANLYSYFQSNRINLRFENVDPLLPWEIVWGAILTVLIVEALRRAVTPILAGLLSLGIAYLFLTEYSPGMLYYRHMPFDEIVETMYLLNGMGIYGSITGIAATTVAIFVIFGAFIEVSGVGRLFHNLGTRVAGRQSGGPAKVEVVSSALFGTISGSSTANVFATGSFTIPAMIKLGYKRHFAGGVEAASSVGGQIMPPVMGAGAFVMAEITNIPYSQIVIAAILGSICYFFMILVSVHFEAKRLGLVGVDPADIPAWRVVLDDLHLLLPVFVLIGMLAVQYSPSYSAFWSILTVPLCTWLRKSTRLYPKDFWRILVNGGRNMMIVGLACAGASMVIACLTVTGFIIQISSLITSVSGGNILIAGVLLMGTTILLGMGVPTTAAYVIGASIGAPILIQLGVPKLAAHMFVFYFSILADATPPVSVASYAAASIARADPMRTGLVAFRLAIAGFLVGFSYLSTPALLMRGPWEGIVAEMALNLIGLTLFAASLSGFFRGHLNWPVRGVLAATAVVLLLHDGYDVLLRIGVMIAIGGLLFAQPSWFGGARIAAQRPAS